ncbi:ISL3 family transposase [Crossiella sp. SN42]|uniref:ISL3 family transposase n=1 Tax=Crossiella sp. SN42 TaxID=2944808 RepID=UPI00207C2FB4|nr:ISL3 family transposase [Crossiella sp. SN42]MCO1579896.1 ISL3 family transposase [Crossiella sp. SN42]
MWASPRAEAVPCPRCGDPATGVHSRYERRLADSPVAGRKLVLRLRVRRWFCDGTACLVKTFAEQVDGLTVRDGRRRPLLRAMLERIAVALAGRAGSRLATSLSAPASRSTLLRLVMSLPGPSAVTPKVLGVDDFALRGGQHYGTVLIDCETGEPLELLPGRDSQTLADWLTAHPGVEVVCRDRSGAYADGVRLGAPAATQVADRFQLWQNIAKAVERCVTRHRGCLRATEPGAPDSDTAHLHSQQEEPAGRFAQRARLHHAKVHELLAQGHSIRGIARGLGWGQKAVQRYARAATWQDIVDGKWKGPRSSKLDPFKPYLQGELLPEWIAAVRADDLPGLTSFANGLQSDLDAVTAGLTTPWNSGPVEGRVNHIKMIKRQMFGRAGLALLRKRVLLTAVRH